MHARILWRLAEQRLPRPPGTKYIRQCDQPNKDHDPTGNPCESNHGRLPTGLSPRLPDYLRAHVQAPWRPRGDDMEAGPPSETRAVSARTLQGMARVRSGQAPPGPWFLTGGGAETPLDFDCQAAPGIVTRCAQAVASS